VIKKLNIYLNRKKSLYFLLTIIITSGGNFFVTIFLWNKLSVNDFAVIAILEIIPMFILGLMTLSLDQYLMRHYYEWVAKNRISNLIYVWIISVLIGTVIFILFSIIAYLFSNSLFQDNKILSFLILSLINIYITSLYNIPFSIIRITNSPKYYFAVKVSAFFVYVIFIFFLVHYNNLGLVGYFTSLIISNVFHLIATITIHKNNFFTLEKFIPSISVKPIIRYITPLVPANIFGSLFGVMERILLQKFVSLDLIGHLSIANKFAELINQLHGILKLSYGPNLFKTITSKDESKIYNFSFNAKSYIFPIIFLFISILSFSSYIIMLFDLKGGGLINEMLRLSIIFVTLNSLQIYVAPGPIVTKKTEVKFLLDLILLIVFTASTFICLKYYNIFIMLQFKNIFILIFLFISYFITKKIIIWKLDNAFLKPNLFLLFLIILSTFFKIDFILSLGIFIVFLLLNFKTISLFYANYK